MTALQSAWEGAKVPKIVRFDKTHTIDLAWKSSKAAQGSTQKIFYYDYTYGILNINGTMQKAIEIKEFTFDKFPAMPEAVETILKEYRIVVWNFLKEHWIVCGKFIHLIKIEKCKNLAIYRKDEVVVRSMEAQHNYITLEWVQFVNIASILLQMKDEAERLEKLRAQYVENFINGKKVFETNKLYVYHTQASLEEYSIESIPEVQQFTLVQKQSTKEEQKQGGKQEVTVKKDQMVIMTNVEDLATRLLQDKLKFKTKQFAVDLKDDRLVSMSVFNSDNQLKDASEPSPTDDDGCVIS